MKWVALCGFMMGKPWFPSNQSRLILVFGEPLKTTDASDTLLHSLLQEEARNADHSIFGLDPFAREPRNRESQRDQEVRSPHVLSPSFDQSFHWLMRTKQLDRCSKECLSLLSTMAVMFYQRQQKTYLPHREMGYYSRLGGFP